MHGRLLLTWVGTCSTISTPARPTTDPGRQQEVGHMRRFAVLGAAVLLVLFALLVCAQVQRRSGIPVRKPYLLALQDVALENLE